MNTPITIKSAAIRLSDATIIPGASHAMAIMTATMTGKVSDADLVRANFVSGFITSAGDFVSRELAFEIAQAAGQCKADSTRRLESEQLARV